MGRVQHGGRTKGSAKSQLKSFKTKRYTRDLDQIQFDLSLAHAVRSLPSTTEEGGGRVKVKQVFGGRASGTVTDEVDEDTPGMGEWPCVECARFFADKTSLDGHVKSKMHKRRVKDLKRGAFTQADSNFAAGLGTDNRQRPASVRPPLASSAAGEKVDEGMVEQMGAVAV